MKIRNMKHQDDALKASAGKDFFAYWLDPGTGKTRVTLLDGWRAYNEGKIDAILVMAPNNVKDSWVKWDHMKEYPEDEDQVTIHLREHLPKIIKGLWNGSATGANKKAWAEFEDRIENRNHKLIVLSVNWESLLTEQFFEFLKAFCQEYRVMAVADESTRIGKPGSKRTKRAIKLGDLCAMRRALSGTPVLKSPLKAYSQARFLSPKALPFKSFFAFRNTFCVMGGFQGRQVLSYKNLEYLTTLMDKWSIRVTKEDALDLPPRIYVKRRVYMTSAQEKHYKTMREEFFADVNGKEITASIVLAQMTRLQQITGGYLNDEQIIPPAENPKLLQALEIIQDAEKQVVVWCRFVSELLGLSKLLEENGISFFQFYGGVPKNDRGAIKAGFKRGDRKVLIGTESTGGIGINEFVGADTVIHISSDFDTEKRVQADDRNHRIGSEQHVKITYFDIMVPNTVDIKVHRVLRGDSKISAQVLKDKWREWI